MDPKRVHFFKIILDDTIRDGKLCIPRKLVRSYGNDLSNPIILKVPSGAKCKVELVKYENEVWLHRGWQEFMNYYSLVHGSFLVFEYNRSTEFNVIIFDKSATEMDYPFSISNGDNDNSESDDSAELLNHSSQPNKKIKLKNCREQVEAKTGGFSSQKQTGDEVVVRIKPLGSEGKAKTLDRAATNFKSKNPFFMIAMQPTYIHIGNLAIPARFVRKYFVKKCGNAIFRSVNGKTWSVLYEYHVGSHGKASATISHGSKEFTEQNHLQVGDVCVFELIDRATTTLKVVIFRSNKDSSSNPSLDNAGTRKQLKQEENSGAVEDANKFTSTNPFFISSIGYGYLKHGNLSVPKRFCAKCTNKATENIMLEADSRRWPVKLINYDHAGKLSAGWSSFAKENCLQVGDVCVFELIDTENVLLRVTIFRNVK